MRQNLWTPCYNSTNRFYASGGGVGQYVRYVLFAGIVIGSINIGLFVFALATHRYDFLTEGAIKAGYDFDQVSFEVAVLAAVVALVTLIFAMLAFLGFGVMVERAELKADKTARDVVNELHKGGKLQAPGGTSAPQVPLPNVAAVAVGRPQPEGEA